METEKFEPIHDGKTKANQSKVIFAIVIAVIFVLILAVAVMARSNNAEAIFKKQIDQMLTFEQADSYDTMKMNMDFEINMEGSLVAEETTDLLNNTKASINFEIDNRSQEELYGLKLVKAGEELIDAEAKVTDEKAYVNLGEFFSKTIEMDISDGLTQTDSNMTETLTFMQFVNAKKAESILKKEVKNQLNSNYFASEKVSLDGEKVNKNTFKMSGKELKDSVEKVCTNLSQNDDFIDCFKDADEIKDGLKEIMDMVKEAEIPDDTYFEIVLYTNGIVPKNKRVDFIVTENDEKVSIEATKTAEEEYAYQFLANDEKVMEGTVKSHITDDEFDVETTAEAEGTRFTLKVAADVVYNEELSDFPMNNLIKLEELTNKDIMELYTNFMGSKLYEIVNQVSGSMEDLSGATQDSFETKKTTSNLPDNIVETYEGKKVQFAIPEGFEVYASDSEHYKLFEKKLGDETIEADVSIEYSTLDEYVQEIKEKAQYYEQEEEYHDIKVSDVEKINIDGNSFSKITLSYEYELWEGQSEKYEDIYIAKEIDSEYVYTVEVENSNLINDKELEPFLKIQIDA